MIDAQFFTFLIAITLLTVTPGVDTLLIIRNTARGGWKDGVISSFGICSGLFIHATISAIGISVILLQTAWAFSALKFAGAGYLVWLGIGSWRIALKKGQTLKLESPGGSEHNFKAKRSLREGFLSNVLNPKTVVFYMAFLPQFIDPAKSTLYQSFFLAGIHFIIAMVWQSVLAMMVRQAKSWLLKPEVSRFFDGATGSIMMLFGIKLVVDQ